MSPDGRDRVRRAAGDVPGPRPDRAGARSCDDHRVPARTPVRGASVAAVFGGAALLAFLCMPGAVPAAHGTVGALAVSRLLTGPACRSAVCWLMWLRYFVTLTNAGGGAVLQLWRGKHFRLSP